MELNFTEEQKMLRDSVSRFATQELNVGLAERDRNGTFAQDLWLKCGEQGLQGLPVPQELGGSGLDPLSCAIALEALGYGCRDGGLVFSICAHLLACVVPVWKHGSPSQHERYLRGFCDGTLIAANAMTEPDTGSDAFAMKTPRRARWRRLSHHRSQGLLLERSGRGRRSRRTPLTDPSKGYHGGVSLLPRAQGHRRIQRRPEIREARAADLADLRNGLRQRIRAA